MIDELCHSGAWESLGSLSGWGWAGLVLTLVFWVGLLAGFTLLVIRALRVARVRAVEVPNSAGQPTKKEILQAQYARGEITREQFSLRKQDI